MTDFTKGCLEICTVAACSNMCNYCPQKDLIAAHNKLSNEKINFKTSVPKMSWDIFKICIDKVPTEVIIDFAGFVEPFHSDLCHKMITWVHDKGHKVRLFTTASGLKREYIDEIKKVPFIVSCIHLPDDLGILKIDVTLEYVENLNYYIEQIPSIAHVFGPLHKKLEHLRRKIIIEDKDLTSQHLINRGGHIKNSNLIQLNVVKKKTGKLWCKSPYMNNGGPFGRINYNVMYINGDVLLCCCCYGLEHKLGNLTVDTYDSLFESDEYKRVIQGLNGDESVDILCRTCDMSVQQ